MSATARDTATEDRLIFLPETVDPLDAQFLPSWKILIADDDPDVHTATTYALESIRILGRTLQILHAYSASEARQYLEQESEIAVMLLDVVMETNDAGLKLIRVAREELKLDEIRIILRTGQPGYAPELEVINRYDINDYRTKSDLTQLRLLTSITTALRSYKQIVTLNNSRRGLEKIIQSGGYLLTQRGVNHFAEGILTQITALLSLPIDGMVCAEDSKSRSRTIIATAGSFAPMIGLTFDQIPDQYICSCLNEAFATNASVFTERATVVFFGGNEDRSLAAFLATPRQLEPYEQYLLQVFCQNISLANDNLNLIDNLHRLAYIDSLCELPNRAGFINAIQEAIDRSARDHVVVVLDIDYFGATSETIGSRDAELLLTNIGQRLQSRLNDGVLIARISGDVFGLLGTHYELAPDHLSAIFNEPIDVNGLTLTISVTSGRASLPPAAIGDSADVIRCAFMALKRAKETSRGSDQVFTGEMAEHLRERTNLLQSLRQAIRDQDFFLVFQPQIDFATGKTIGLEALIRWQQKNGGYLPPDRFIDVAEHSGLIIPLGEFVMRSACKQLSKLRAQGYTDLRMAINVSMMQWLDRGFPALVESLLQEFMLPASAIELEITESVAMQGAGPALDVMSRFKSLDLQLALDDFGTGFSSLSYLAQLPVDRLKIDRSFVSTMEHSPRNYALAETIIRLGQNLGVKVIAEGVENEAQAQLLKKLGCHEAQGYYYAYPLQAVNLPNWLRLNT